MMIETVRKEYTADTSIGVTTVDGAYFCKNLEDAARAYGVKVQNKTCIPPGEYRVAITDSNRFKRPMILLYTNEADMSCEHGGIRFTGIRVHGGNTHENTAGCILVAFDRVGPDRIKRTAENPLYERVKVAMSVGEKVTWVVRNEKQVA